MNDRAWQHPWLRIQRLIRAILEVHRDTVTRPVMRKTLTEALKEREKIRRAGWFSSPSARFVLRGVLNRKLRS